jgi:hypothetical protein
MDHLWMNRLWVEDLVQDARQILLGFFAFAIIAMPGSCNPRKHRDEHA